MHARVCNYLFNYTSKSPLSNVSNKLVAYFKNCITVLHTVISTRILLWKIRCKIKSFNNSTQVPKTFLFIGNFFWSETVCLILPFQCWWECNQCFERLPIYPYNYQLTTHLLWGSLQKASGLLWIIMLVFNHRKTLTIAKH